MKFIFLTYSNFLFSKILGGLFYVKLSPLGYRDWQVICDIMLITEQRGHYVMSPMTGGGAMQHTHIQQNRNETPKVGLSGKCHS